MFFMILHYFPFHKKDVIFSNLQICIREISLSFIIVHSPGMPLGQFKKVGKYRGPGSKVQARAFSQSELPRKPPIDTHGRYTYNTWTKRKKKKKEEGKKKSQRRKNGIPDSQLLSF